MPSDNDDEVDDDDFVCDDDDDGLTCFVDGRYPHPIPPDMFASHSEKFAKRLDKHHHYNILMDGGVMTKVSIVCIHNLAARLI